MMPIPVAEKLGERFERATVVEGYDVVIYGIDRAEPTANLRTA